MSSLSLEEALEIGIRAAIMTQREIAAELGMSLATVNRRMRALGLRRRLQSVRRGARLRFDEVREIRAKRAAGRTTRALAEEYRVSRQTISSIVNGKSWKEESSR